MRMASIVPGITCIDAFGNFYDVLDVTTEKEEVYGTEVKLVTFKTHKTGFVNTTDLSGFSKRMRGQFDPVTLQRIV